MYRVVRQDHRGIRLGRPGGDVLLRVDVRLEVLDALVGRGAGEDEPGAARVRNIDRSAVVENSERVGERASACGRASARW